MGKRGRKRERKRSRERERDDERNVVGKHLLCVKVGSRFDIPIDF